ncbi:hypothetical protein NCLIV_023250 [Neospora caninum Liverpool]|uniref:Uncharacterized protein n=1 Tax=Neospora caninum (strain Liverpool) TaxID=572307 RepID=F0VFP3_NEOCL|nr:hypothetical protein NCLIV_023250 [Neospora caninum Liverpool]CBZ52537.1 hypothetical protein NCLIV_023250 [Neospora caninum Liverpool]CEL66513.1 TPA: hypothetical protein BN1204_023250 [Neospora caninum Liverpool]|eukprot:XP_003882569.1 hypothetical protein NCLIV_023250 [Neospora caninum Liverpool]
MRRGLRDGWRREDESGRRGAGSTHLSYGEDERRRDRDEGNRKTHFDRHREDYRHQTQSEGRNHGYPSDLRVTPFSSRRCRPRRPSDAFDGHAARRSRSRTPTSYEASRRGRDTWREEGMPYRGRQRSRERERTKWRHAGPRPDHRDDRYSIRRDERRSFSSGRGMERREGQDARGDDYREGREAGRGDSHAGRREGGGMRDETEERPRGDIRGQRVVQEREARTIQFTPVSQTNRDEPARGIESDSTGARPSASTFILRPRGEGVGPSPSSQSPAFPASYVAAGGERRNPLSAPVVRLSPVSAPSQGFAAGQREGREDERRGEQEDSHEEGRGGPNVFEAASRHREHEDMHRPHAVAPGCPMAAGQEPGSLQPFGAQMCPPPPPTAPAFPSVPQADSRFRPPSHHSHAPFPPPSCHVTFHSASAPPVGPPGGLCPRPGSGPVGLCRPPYPPPVVVGPAARRAVPESGEGAVFLSASSRFGRSDPPPHPPHMVPHPPYFGPPGNGGVRPIHPPARHGLVAGPLGSDGSGRPPLGAGSSTLWGSGGGEEHSRAAEGPGRAGLQRQFDGESWREKGVAPGFADGACRGAENTPATAPVVLRLSGVPGPLLTHENMLSFCSMFGQVAHVDVQPGQQSVRVTFADPAAAAEAGRNAPRAFGTPALVVEVISQLSGASAAAVSASPPSAAQGGASANAVLIHTPGSNKFVSPEYVEKKKQLEELQRKREQCAKKKQELLTKLTGSLQKAIARLTDAETPENEKEAVRAMIASIKEKISLLSDDKQKDARPEEEARLEEKLRRLQAEAFARGLNPRLLLQQAAAQNPYKLDFRTTYIKCSGPSLENIQDQETFTEWVIAHSDALLADAIEAVLRVDEGGTSFCCLKYINRQAAEQAMRNSASLNAQLEWMAPPALPDASACVPGDASLLETREGEDELVSSSLAASAYEPMASFAASGPREDGDGRQALAFDSDLDTLRREESREASRGEETRNAHGPTPGATDRPRMGHTTSRDGGKPFEHHPHNLQETEVDYDFE